MTITPTFPSPECRYEHRVSYGETDCMGVVYYAEYLHLFERARSEFIRERGMSYSRVEEEGFFLPVREAHCRYLFPARYDDLIVIRTGIEAWTRASVRFIYEVSHKDSGKPLCTGFTQHACVNREGRPVRIPEWLKKLMSDA